MEFTNALKLIVIVLTMTLSSPVFSQTVADRLLFEIDLESYSQSQMELYLLAKEVLAGGAEITPIDALSWDRRLEEFKNDMVVHQEAVRLGSFEASARVMEKALDIFQEQKSKIPGLVDQLKRLSVDDQAVRRTVGIAVRVEGFRRSKKRQTAVQQNRVETSLAQQRSMPEWQEELIHRSVVRFYDGANIFKPIQLQL